MSLVEAILEVKRAPTHGVRPEDLNPNKFKQRAAAAGYLSKHRTIIEFGGSDLSERVYVKLNPRRLILVQDDAEGLDEARIRLADAGVMKQFYPMRPERFIPEKARLFSDITLVDFNSATSLIPMFLESFRVRRPVVLAFTGEFQDMAMKNLGVRKHFKAWLINRTFEGRTMHGAYVLRPIVH
jgi:hypothetical protein